jgi:hypothetical protein
MDSKKSFVSSQRIQEVFFIRSQASRLRGRRRTVVAQGCDSIATDLAAEDRRQLVRFTYARLRSSPPMARAGFDTDARVERWLARTGVLAVDLSERASDGKGRPRCTFNKLPYQPPPASAGLKTTRTSVRLKRVAENVTVSRQYAGVIMRPPLGEKPRPWADRREKPRPWADRRQADNGDA